MGKGEVKVEFLVRQWQSSSSLIFPNVCILMTRFLFWLKEIPLVLIKIEQPDQFVIRIRLCLVEKI